MPADGLALAVRVGRQIDLIGLLGLVGQALDDVLFVLVDHIFRFKAVLDVHAERRLRQIPYVAARRVHGVFLPKILFNGLGLGRRLDNYQFHSYLSVVLPFESDPPKRGRSMFRVRNRYKKAGPWNACPIVRNLDFQAICYFIITFPPAKSNDFKALFGKNRKILHFFHNHRLPTPERLPFSAFFAPYIWLSTGAAPAVRAHFLPRREKAGLLHAHFAR